jgi:hypothetical protein
MLAALDYPARVNTSKATNISIADPVLGSQPALAGISGCERAAFQEIDRKAASCALSLDAPSTDVISSLPSLPVRPSTRHADEPTTVLMATIIAPPSTIDANDLTNLVPKKRQRIQVSVTNSTAPAMAATTE